MDNLAEGETTRTETIHDDEKEAEEPSSPAGLEPEGSRGSSRALDAMDVLIRAVETIDEGDCYEDDAASPGNYYIKEPPRDILAIAGDKTSSEEKQNENGTAAKFKKDSGQAGGDKQGQEEEFHSNKGQSTREDEEKKDFTPSEEAEETPRGSEHDLQLEDIINAVNRAGTESAEGGNKEAETDSSDVPSSSTLTEERPTDASGICSLDEGEIPEGIPGGSPRGTLSPIHEPKDPPVRRKQETTNTNEYQSEQDVNTTQTPLGTPDKEASKAAIATATAPAQDPYSSPTTASSSLSDELLRNKEKEGFGLLARGESYPTDTLQQEQQQPQHIEYSSGSRRALDPDVVHRRAANNFTPLNDMSRQSEHQEMMENTSQYDNSSYRPSYSYPSSPQQLPTQAIAFQNGGYVVMPHHPAQPPHAFIPQSQHHMLQHQSSFGSQPQIIGRSSFGYQTMAPAPPPLASPAPGGKRKIRLRLQEEILSNPSHARRSSFFQFPRRSSRKMNLERPMESPSEQVNEVDRGAITVSWFEGTSSIELVDHVTRSITRKLKLGDDKELDDIRVLDTNSDPPEEIVLCPYIPSGSEFVLRYKVKAASGNDSSADVWNGGPPDSPSAAPSPFPSHGNLGSLNSTQLSALRKRLDDAQGEPRKGAKYSGNFGRRRSMPDVPKSAKSDKDSRENRTEGTILESSQEIKNVDEAEASENESETDTFQPENENSVDAKLRQITELLLMDRQKEQHRYPRVKKRQVLMVLANYFVVFIAFITISAEIQARAPSWLSWMETELENVQNCSADKDALFKCVSNGEFAGLFASVILWLSRSATTKRFFLFGFETPQKLWAVFYESLVGAICWGCSYMFIRRGMNPDTRPNFLQKYWKDALYGSLAGFNATFMKQVLKNLIPQEAVEEAFNDRQLKILSWLPSFA